MKRKGLVLLLLYLLLSIYVAPPVAFVYRPSPTAPEVPLVPILPEQKPGLDTALYLDTPKVVAHRGASDRAPENTLPAFRLAWEQGADAIEADVRQTRDGHIVCIHDKTTTRVAGKKLVVRKATLSELRALDVGAYRGDIFRGTRIPTLAEVLATVPEEKSVYIDVKCDVSIVPQLLREIDHSRLESNQVVIISSNKNVAREVKRRSPQYKTAWLVGFNRAIDGRLLPSLATVLRVLGNIKADWLSSGHGNIDQAFIDDIVEEGYKYHVWTVDDPATALRFREWGAESVTTNVPAKLLKLFTEPAL